MENDGSTPAPLSPDHMSDDQINSDPSKTSIDPLPLLTSANYETADKNVVDAALSLMSKSSSYKKERTPDLVGSKDSNQNFVNENLFNEQFSVASSHFLPPTQPIPLTTTSFGVEPMITSYEAEKCGSNTVPYVSKAVNEAIFLKREPGSL